MQTDSQTKRSPFSEPLKPLVPNQKRTGVEEIKMKEGSGMTSSAKALSQKEAKDQSGFSSLPVDEKKQKRAGEVVLASTDTTLSDEGSAPRWKFWKRRNHKEQQLEVLRQGCNEMVGVMRSMKEEIELGREERVGVKTSLSPLPVAVASLQSLSKTQEKTGEILSELKTCVERSGEREYDVAHSLSTFNDSMATVGRTFVGLEKRSERSVDALQRLNKRIEESDKLHQAMFDRLRDSEHEFAEQMGRSSQRGAFAMVSACAIMSLAIVFMTVSLNQQRYSMEIQSLPSPAALAEQEAVTTSPADPKLPEAPPAP